MRKHLTSNRKHSVKEGEEEEKYTSITTLAISSLDMSNVVEGRREREGERSFSLFPGMTYLHVSTNGINELIFFPLIHVCARKRV
jgi:hypothetical protein